MTDLNVCIRFCVKLGKFCAEFLSVGSSFWRADSGRNTSFGEQTVGGAQVSDRFSKSISTEPYPEECEHSCQVVNKTGENVDKVKKLVFESRRIAVEMSECWEFHWIV